MRVGVTGAAGFIGSACVNALHAAGHEATPIDISDGHDLLTAPLPDLLHGADAVIHLAGVLGTSELFEQIDRAVDVNVKGTARVLDACRETGAAFVGITMPPVFPSIYTATKVAAQRIAEAYHHAHGVPVTHIRAFNAYGAGQKWGPGHPQKIVPTFAALSWRGRPMPIWGDGRQTVDMVHVDDIAANLSWAATHTDDEPFGACQVYDAGTGQASTVLDVAMRVRAITGCGLVEFLPMRTGEIPQADLAAEHFGPFTPAVPWDRFAETVESYRPAVEAAA